ncbi:MAG: lytic transglycosylase domain-containing protein [Bacteroides sp.]|nr:lytic transglycosylase domain-containing protein [Prevotella sp.]MCM1407185.1 lytic transglycosylase domain-containing protein [Treponema brennaborense]MCM1470337.1 lytic transglycosylase domain-containing protein [Bacteroides sp.]
MNTKSIYGDMPFVRSCYGTVCFAFALLLLCILALLVPARAENSAGTSAVSHAEDVLNTNASLPAEHTASNDSVPPEHFSLAVSAHAKKEDSGLRLYRSMQSRAAVIWFYTQITKDTEVAAAILHYADKNDIPLSLAFALAHTESAFKADAVNKNQVTIDRGLFQLNDSSFPQLTEEQFFDPEISAKHGLAFLRYCIDCAGNEVGGLAMYNAGPGRVRSNSTPQRTLNYVSVIMDYRNGLDELFKSQIEPFYANENNAIIAQLAY